MCVRSVKRASAGHARVGDLDSHLEPMIPHPWGGADRDGEHGEPHRHLTPCIPRRRGRLSAPFICAWVPLRRPTAPRGAGSRPDALAPHHHRRLLHPVPWDGSVLVTRLFACLGLRRISAGKFRGGTLDCKGPHGKGKEILRAVAGGRAPL